MTGKLLFEERLEIPMNLHSLGAFRRWTASDEFPQEGRIDYVQGQIEVDMSPEDLFTHGTVKTEIVAVLVGLAKARVAGDLFSDRTRISSVPGDVSAEPDIVFVSEESLRSGRVRLIPKASGEPDRYVEIDGGPDVIVEVVSDTSAGKDSTRLPRAYYLAGVLEARESRPERHPLALPRSGPSGQPPRRAILRISPSTGSFLASTRAL